MFRKYWIDPINEGFTAFRLWSNLFDDFENGGALIRGFALASAPTGSVPAESGPRGPAATVIHNSIFAPADTDILILAPVAALAAATEPAVPEPIISIEPQASLPASGNQPAASATINDRFQISYSDVLDPGDIVLVPGVMIDMATRQLLTGGADDPPFGVGNNDSLILSGDFTSGAVVPGALSGLDSVLVQQGADYRLSVTDENVATGDRLHVNAMPLGPGEHIEFDGSAEVDGQFAFFGSQGGDSFEGGGGNDRILGLGGADLLIGGGGADHFAYLSATESSGDAYDTLADFNPGQDRIDLFGTVSGFGDAVEGGSLSTASFDADLGAALGTDGLGAGEAVLFAPDAGDLAGTLFLIVDANGEEGYQAGEDYVFALPNADLAALDGNTAIFV